MMDEREGDFDSSSNKSNKTKKKQKNPEVKKIREALVDQGYTDSSIFRDSYIDRVITVPDRSFDRSTEKFVQILEWRKEFKVEELTLESLKTQIGNGSVYYYGYSVDKHPILWIHASLKPWRNMDVEAEIRATVLIIEDMVNKFLPRNIDSFYIVINAEHLGPRDFDMSLMKGLINLLVKAYPDRTQGIFVGPTNMVVRTIFKLVSPFLPERLLEKVRLMKKPAEELAAILGEDNVPSFFGGKFEQPDFLNENKEWDYENVRKAQQGLYDQIAPKKKKKKSKKSKKGKKKNKSKN